MEGEEREEEGKRERKGEEEEKEDASPVSPIPTCLSRSRQPSLSKHLSNLALYLLQETSRLTKSCEQIKCSKGREASDEQ